MDIIKKMSYQFIFDLSNYDNFDTEDYYVSSSNKDAASLINIFPKWHNNGAVIIGSLKSGKTHLAHIWKSKSNAKLYNFDNDIDLNSIDTRQNSVFDNFNLIDEADEKVFFQIYNNIINNNNFILFLVNSQNTNKIRLNDLQSRIESLTTAIINVPDDQLIQAILLKFFNDHQINVTPDVIKFIIARINRNYEEIFIFLDKINKLSLEHQNKISIPFLNKFIDF